VQRHRVPASDDTWRTEMKRAFPGPTAARNALLFLFSQVRNV